MSVAQSLAVALRSLRVNSLRSTLTMLGIIIGVAAVIATVAVGAGAQARVAEQIQSLGSDLIIVLSGSVNSGGVRLGQGSQLTLTEDDAAALEREVAGATTVAASIRGPAQVVYRNLNWSTAVHGITVSYPTARDWDIASGRAIAPEDIDSATKIALVGRTVAENLFGAADPVGEVIRVRNVPFTVVGVLAAKGQTTVGQDQDDVILVPISTAKKKVLGRSLANPRAVGTIWVKMLPGEDLSRAESQVRDVLRQRHRLPTGHDDDFRLRNLADVIGTQEASSKVMTYLLAAIASVSLLVGGIGIMNIMLVSITERTREIGLRLAVGARRHDILTQFLVEAVTLALIGGVLGVAAGIGAANAISYLAEWRTLVAPQTVALAFGFAGTTGVFFGFYPARKAARLDPIEALRHE